MSAVGRRERKNHEELVTAYGVTAVAQALDAAAEAKAADHIGFANDWLRERVAPRASRGAPAAAAPPAAIADRLLCDLCGLPSWTNAMVERNGRGVCERCAAVAGEATAAPSPPAPTWLYPELPTVDALLNEETALLTRWYTFAAPAKLTDRIAQALARRGIADADLPPRATAYRLQGAATPTPVALAVRAYWQRVGGVGA